MIANQWGNYKNTRFWRLRKGDKFSKIANQDGHENKKSNSQYDKNIDKNQNKNKRIQILGESMIKNLKDWEMPKKIKKC